MMPNTRKTLGSGGYSDFRFFSIEFHLVPFDSKRTKFFIMGLLICSLHDSENAAPASPGRTAVFRMPVTSSALPPPPAGIASTANWKSEHDAKYTPIVYLQSSRYTILLWQLL